MTTEITITLDDDLLARIETAAAADGVSSEAWAARALADAFRAVGVREDVATFDHGLQDDLLARMTPEARAYQHTASLAALEEYDRTGEYITLDDWAAEFRNDVKARLAAR